MINSIRKGYVIKTHLFTLKILANVCFIPPLDVAIDAGNQLRFDPVVCAFKFG